MPVRLLVKDSFRSDQRVERVKAPCLLFRANAIGCFRETASGFTLLFAPRRDLCVFGGRPATDLDQYGALDVIRGFLAEPPG
jgi:hypothetical protein